MDVDKGAAPGDLTLSPEWVVDLEFRFRPVAAIQLAVGANNLLDEYPDRTPYGVVDGYDYGLNTAYLPYSYFSPFGFSGRFVYGRVSVAFYRSAESHVGKEWISAVRSRWSPYN